jgi:hypothetical protein
MCNFGVITVNSTRCNVEPAHVWYKYTYILCNDNGKRCADAQQDGSQIDPNADNNYTVGSRSLGPCYVCDNLKIAVDIRDKALARAEEIRTRALDAYGDAEDRAYSEVTEVR